MSNCYSIGIERDDGDFHILATLNNNDQLMTEEVFETFRTIVVSQLRSLTDAGYITAMERQDAPDYINLEIGD